MRNKSLPMCLRIPCLLAAAAVAGSGCSSDSPQAGPCETGAIVAGCGRTCASDSECGSGLHCEGGECTSECTPDRAVAYCGAGMLCTSAGRCAPDPDASGPGDSGATSGDSSTAGEAGSDGDADGTDGSVEGCGEVTFGGDPRTPNVLFIIDQSSSMNQGFGGEGNRWTVLKDTLLADEGLIADLEHLVRFGVVLYSAENGSSATPAPPPIGECPALTSVDWELQNLEAIRSVYGPADMIEDTPTGDAIDAVLDDLIESGRLDPTISDQESQEPTVFILATDGEPDTCEALDPQSGQGEAVQAIERAYNVGVRTFVIAVAEEDEISQEHLTDIANAGAGVQPGQPDAPSYRVNDQDGLRETLLRLVSDEISCELDLRGRVTTPDPCVGTVELGQQPLECNSQDGWRLIDERTIEVMGEACEALKAGELLHASFPCGTAVLI